MNGYYDQASNIPRLAVSSAVLHNSLASPGPNSAPASIPRPNPLGSRFEHSTLPTFFVSDGTMGKSPIPGSSSARLRRKSSAGVEQVKHRRTRSGCYTCRTRRVKCDETHPTCERCQKGGRECNYPDLVPTAKSSASRKREKAAPREGSSSLDELEEEDESLVKVKSESHGFTAFGTQQIEMALYNCPETSFGKAVELGSSRRTATAFSHSPSPQTEGNFHGGSSTAISPSNSLRRTVSQASLRPGLQIGNLPSDTQLWIVYHMHRLTYHHYLLKSDNTNFFKTTFIDFTVKNEALLYAVSAFSAFHWSVENKAGSCETFLEFYNIAVQKLRKSIANGKYTMATLITILQLASFEEYMGDWGNLMQHRNAATRVIRKLHTPESMAQTPENRLIFGWLSRFDIYASMMAGHLAQLEKSWSIRSREYQELEAMQDSNNIVLVVEAATALLRDLAMNASFLVAKRSQNGGLSDPEIESQSLMLRKQYADWWAELNPIILLEAEEVPRPPGATEEDEPFLPSRAYTGLRMAVNYLLLDYYALKILMNFQLPIALEAESITDDEENPHDSGSLAVKCCKILSAMQGPSSKPYILLPTQAQLALIALWLPPVPHHRAWLRKQLAKMEELGYIFPRVLRNTIAEKWGDPTIEHTYSTTESKVNTLIRDIMDIRENEASILYDRAREDIKEMRALLSNLNLDKDSSSAGSPNTVASSTLSSPHPILQAFPQQHSPRNAVSRLSTPGSTSHSDYI
ncbi:hypothetical protein EV426DRAFT_125068 [Tirmania nivea]|nr:hypothetical protein EV426DRAFT_125068 [Tirmania nivea]